MLKKHPKHPVFKKRTDRKFGLSTFFDADFIAVT